MIVATRPLRSLFLTLLALLALFGAAARAFEARDLGTEDFEISDVYQHGDMDKPEEFGHLDIRRVLKRVAQLRAAGQHVPRGDAEIADRMDEFRYSGLRKVSHPTATEEFPEYYVDTILDIEPEEANTMSLPNVKDKATVLELAKMTSNAYYSSSESKEWYTLPTYGKPAMSFGWSGNALRGYVYTNASKSVAVIDFKGTSLSFLGIGGPTSANDKIIDNRMFSCCCARVSSGWKTVCDCYRGNGSDNKCSNSCLRSAMQNDSLSYYKAALNIYNQVRSKYPKATVWFTGHSLGGSLASLLSVKTGYPAVPYHAPGELLYGQRLGLPINTGNMGAYKIWHFGSTADPIFRGTCKGAASACAVAGYALETGCHIGNECIYTGGVENVNNHRISVVIDKYISPKPVPACKPAPSKCNDCSQWTWVS